MVIDRVKSAELLKLRVSRILQENPDIQAISLWNEMRKEFVKNLQESDPSDFCNWKVVRKMFCIPTKEPLMSLQQRSDWPRWKRALEESPVGNPRSFPPLPESSGNLIHQAHHVAQLLDGTSCNLEELGEIIEFGGGYGCICRLLFRLGFRGRYVIYDLPEFSALQEYFLSQAGSMTQVVYNKASDTKNSAILLYDMKKLREQFQMSSDKIAFIATWSVSETPPSLRENFFSILSPITYFLFAYRGMFKGIDNSRYFAEFRRVNNTYNWFDWKIEYLSGNERYLVGERK